MTDEPRDRAAPPDPTPPAAPRNEPPRRWAGWGAGPAGSGAVGGPSRIFLGLALVAALVVAGVLFRDGKRVEAAVALGAAVYFALRVFGGLGRRRRAP